MTAPPSGETPDRWQHRFVAANGARFHVAEAGSASHPAVVLLHGFPQSWWAWRHQLPALADAGYRAVAMDLRGYGGSDKTPRGYDPTTLSRDVAGVVKALGIPHAVLVGQGWGGYVAWAATALHPEQVRGLVAVAAPHPLTMLRTLSTPAGRLAARHVLAMQLPMLPERRLADASSGMLASHLRAWSSPSSGFPSDVEVATYQDAMRVWPSSHCALEYHRWLLRSRLRADGRAFSRSMRDPLDRPVLCVRGADDPAVPASAVTDSRRHVAGPSAARELPGVGHYPPEEAPDAFTTLLLEWLDTVG